MDYCPWLVRVRLLFILSGLSGPDFIEPGDNAQEFHRHQEVANQALVLGLGGLFAVQIYTAASLVNIKLSEDLIRAKKVEAFQTLSAFFVHDLRNLTSMLSLTMQNLAAHFHNPDFRKDAMSTMSKSVAKINDM